MFTHTQPSFEALLASNEQFVSTYKSTSLMKLITSEDMAKKECRARMLSLIQTLSNYFQKMVLLRSALSDDLRFSAAALDHLKDEFCHHEQLSAERDHEPPTWDPVLEATCSWFTWKMLTSSDEEKVVLVHLILEASGSVFFQAAHEVLQQYGIRFFEIHSEADEEHEKMGRDLLLDLSPKHYQRLLEIQDQGWQMMITACDRIADLSVA